MKILFALAVALAAASPATAGYRYTTVDGPSAGAPLLGTVVTSINDSGHAVGYYVTDDGAGGPGNYTAFTVDKDGTGFTSFTRSGYAQTGAAGIDNAGDITGVSVTSLGHGTGFVRSGADGSYADIDPNLDPSFGAVSVYSEAIGINNVGAVTGYYTTDPAATVGTLAQYAHGFIAYGGVYTAVDVDPLAGYGTQVTSINDLGVFTGTYLDNSADHFSHPLIGIFAPGAGAAIISLDTDPFGARRRRSATSPTTSTRYTTRSIRARAARPASIRRRISSMWRSAASSRSRSPARPSPMPSGSTSRPTSPASTSATPGSTASSPRGSPNRRAGC